MVEMPAIGERVKITTSGPAGTTTHEGVVLPGAAPEHLTVKLANGYNVSHPISMVESLVSIADANQVQASISSVQQNQQLPKVTIIHTGGTIASKVDYATGAVIARFEPEELLASVPEILEIANIDAIKIGNMWSDDIRPIHWNKMIDACQDAFDSGDATDPLGVAARSLSDADF